MAQGFHQQLVVDVVEESLDVDVYYPIIPQAIDTALLHRLVCRLIGSVAIRMVAELLVHYRLQFRGYHLLRHPVGDGRDAQGSFLAVSFWDHYLQYWLGVVASARQSVPKWIQVLAYLGINGFDAYIVHPSTAPIGFHQLESFLDLQLTYWLGLVFFFENHPQNFVSSCNT